MWLRDSLPNDLKGARILLYGYDTNLLCSQTFQSIDDVAIAFCKSIRGIRTRENVSRDVNFLSSLKLIYLG